MANGPVHLAQDQVREVDAKRPGADPPARVLPEWLAHRGASQV
jgi:hypothetical protein